MLAFVPFYRPLLRMHECAREGARETGNHVTKQGQGLALLRASNISGSATTWQTVWPGVARLTTPQPAPQVAAFCIDTLPLHKRIEYSEAGCGIGSATHCQPVVLFAKPGTVCTFPRRRLFKKGVKVHH